MANDKNRFGRIETLKQLLETRLLSTQDDVLRALRSKGYSVTQATLSRDMKHLKVVKTRHRNGQYCYAMPNNTSYRITPTSLAAKSMGISGGFVSLSFSGNMAVIKTQQGYAAIIAQAIDNSRLSSVVGTIAGHDTIFLLLAEETNREVATEELSTVIPEIGHQQDFDLE